MTDSDSEHILLYDLEDDDLWNMLDNCAITSTYDNEKNKSQNRCKHCDMFTMVFDSNESAYICSECGVLNCEIFEQKPEWNNYEDGPHDNGRCGVATNPFFPNSSTGTIIGGKGNNRLKMLQIWDQMPYKERALSHVFHHIEGNMKTHKITKAIIECAKILYNNISQLKHKDGPNKGKNMIIRGYNRSGIIAACAFYAAKLNEAPRSVKEIAETFCLKITQVTKGCRKFLELNDYQNYSYNLTSSHAQDFIERNAYKLKLKKQHVELAIKVAINVEKLQIASDHQPTSLAAGSLLLIINMYDLNITKKHISDTFGISEVTITKTFKKISTYKTILLDDKFVELALKKMNDKIKNKMIENISSNTNMQLSDIIKNNFDKIFTIPDDIKDIDKLSDELSETSSVKSVIKTKLNNNSIVFNDNINLDTIQITIDLDNLNVNNNKTPEKKKRGRPRKNIIDSNINEI